MNIRALSLATFALCSMSSYGSNTQWVEVSTQSRLLIGQAFQKQHSETPVYVAELKDLNSPLEVDDLTYYENVELSLGSPTLLESDLLHMRQKVTEHEFRQSSVTYLVRSGEQADREVLFDASISTFEEHRRVHQKSFSVTYKVQNDNGDLSNLKVASNQWTCESPDIQNDLSINCFSNKGEYIGYMQWSDIKELMDSFHSKEIEQRVAVDWYFKFMSLPIY